MELVDPESRCAKYYWFASSFKNPVIKEWFYRKFPDEPEDQIALINPSV